MKSTKYNKMTKRQNDDKMTRTKNNVGRNDSSRSHMSNIMTEIDEALVLHFWTLTSFFSCFLILWVLLRVHCLWRMGRATAFSIMFDLFIFLSLFVLAVP